jgi:hypothetical protein
MRNKKFNFTLNQTEFLVHAEQEGNCRFMVRLSKVNASGTPVGWNRIGYLTGKDKNWVAEYAGKSRNGSSAKQACLFMADYALSSIVQN